MIWEEFHRYNGDTDFDSYMPDGKGGLRKTSLLMSAATESMVSHFNYMTNLHLQTVNQNDLVNIISLVSPMID